MRFCLKETVNVLAIIGFVLTAAVFFGTAQESEAGEAVPGSPQMPIRHIGTEEPVLDHPDGALRLAVGVECRQAFRCSRTAKEETDDLGWTYYHSPMLAYWKGKFYLSFHGTPSNEHFEDHSHTLLCTSADGRNWSGPEIAFPDKGRSYLLHQRMGFFIAPNGRLLVHGHYGSEQDPFGGPGNAIREVREDGSLGPVFFVRYGPGWNEETANELFPYYKQSQDKGFVKACEALLANKLVTDQWYELQKGHPKGAYAKVEGVDESLDETVSSARGKRKSLSYWHRPDGTVVGIWKRAWTSLSFDEGQTWTRPVQAPGIHQAFSKHWGQRTEDGRYALVYSLDHDGLRFPQVIITSGDGIDYDNMLCCFWEVPTHRYGGTWKNQGPQYVRGIVQGNGNPPGRDMWITYSMNKEDIWVSRIPLPVRASVDKPVRDTFNDMEPGGVVTDWNIYSPCWAPVNVVESGEPGNKVLQLNDRDPHDYARAIKIFPSSGKVTIKCRVLAKQADRGRLEIDVLDVQGRGPIGIRLVEEGKVQVVEEAHYEKSENPPLVRKEKVRDLEFTYQANSWLSLGLEIDAAVDRYSVILNEKTILENTAFAETGTESLERLSFRTGKHRVTGKRSATSKDSRGKDAIDPATDKPLKERQAAAYYIDDIFVVSANQR
ncbi:MAG TPA: hypothetical protein VMW16_09485 [Sedimentisphaerales bacterium]|nr:hypothetical protein [Sedimentisphaerales bacterium]